MTRRRGAVAAAVLAMLLLAGCSEIPKSGSVRPGSTEEPNGTSIVYQPNPPAAGARQREIVAGFLTAASAGGDFHVARQYLASSFVGRWRPRTRVLVQETQPTITSTSTTDLRVDVPISAEVNELGVYAPASRVERLDFHLRQQNGQWRIDDAPEGIVLGQTVFGKIYSPQTLEFFDSTARRLVPDLRWFPVSSTSASQAEPSPAAVVRALITGPAGPLGGVAQNPLAGATLSSLQPASGGVTTVSLTVAGGEPDPAVTARMQQQLVQSLLLPTPSSLRLFVNGRAAPPVKALPSAPVSPLPYVVLDGRFGTVAATGAFTEERTIGPRIAALRPTAVTVSLSQGLAAVRTAQGQIAIVTKSGSRVVDRRPGVLLSTLDQRGWVYSVPSDEPGELIASNAKGQSIDLVAPLGGATVTEIEASPDGTRLLVLVQSVSGPRAYVVGIQRNADGTPTGLTAARSAVALGGNVGQGIDATWAEDGYVAVLVSSPDNTTDRVRLQQLGGLGTSLGEIANATSIVGSTSRDDLRIGLQTGDIWTQQSNIWQSESTSPLDVSVLAVQR